MVLWGTCEKCGKTRIQGDIVIECTCREDERNEALAKAIVSEFFEQLAERVEFRTWIHTELSAAVLGNYNTHIVLDRKKEG